MFHHFCAASLISYAASRSSDPALERAKLAEAFGVGRGKHAGKQRREHSNKYAAASKQAPLDPWEQQLRAAEAGASTAAAAAAGGHEGGAEGGAGGKEVRERGLVEFPDEVEIDPYDPTTFGFVEVGVVLGAHGVRGEIKVRCSTGFGDDRLCRGGNRHVKAPNRRYPRKVKLLQGRLQREDVYIVSLDGVSSREQAAKLREHVMYVAADERPELDEGEFMVTDLVGLKAYLDPLRQEY
ncbi:RimM N-terminal domain-containing protein, partial [Tribonema minus]